MESQIGAERNQGEIKVTLSELQQGRKDAQWINDSIPRGNEFEQAITMQGKRKEKKKGQREYRGVKINPGIAREPNREQINRS